MTNRTAGFARAAHAVETRATGLFLAVCVIWLAGIAAAPWAAARTRPGSPAYVAATAVYLVGSVICHQQDRRSFHLDGVQLPVCARCLGIYAAAPFGAWWGWMLRRRRRARWPSDGRDPRWAAWLVAAAMPTVMTVLAEWASGAMTPGGLRFAAGAPLGFVVAWFIAVAPGSDAAAAARRPAGVLE
ncbi:MAG: DUF2085 domain-containing protein [Acidobacteriota bacterium]|nr:DUF2085 domain-containing protein [Acidobacteriota bacterium]